MDAANSIAFVAIILLFCTPLPEFAWDLLTRRKRNREHRKYLEDMRR